jgi:ATP-binding cassette subfamily B protein
VTLSGGQKQRVTLARTLLKNPRILILDDATSSVDTETEAEIREALNNLMAERTTFVIAHRIQSVMTADLILVLEHGRIVQRGTHHELVNQPGIYRRTYDVQARIEEELEDELAAVMTTSNGHQNGKANGYHNGSHVKELVGELETGG